MNTPVPHPGPITLKDNAQMHAYVDECVAQGMKPSAVENAVIRKFQLNSSQVDDKFCRAIANRVAYVRTNRLGWNDYIDEAEAKVGAARFNDGMENHIPFTFGFEVKNGNPNLGNGSLESPVLIGFATKSMITTLTLLPPQICKTCVFATFSKRG